MRRAGEDVRKAWEAEGSAFDADLWKIADNLRANSNLASNEYFMPIRG